MPTDLVAGCSNSHSNSDELERVLNCNTEEGLPLPPWHLAWWLWPTTPPTISNKSSISNRSASEREDLREWFDGLVLSFHPMLYFLKVREKKQHLSYNTRTRNIRMTAVTECCGKKLRWTKCHIILTASRPRHETEYVHMFDSHSVLMEVFHVFNFQDEDSLLTFPARLICKRGCWWCCD